MKRTVCALALTVPLFAAVAAAPLSAPVTRGPASCHSVAFTFDLCPVTKGSGVDAKLIDYLIANHIPATFFVSGEWMSAHDAELRRLIAQPFFEIGTHGEHHAHLSKLKAAQQRAEISGPIETLASRYGVHSTLFRPPYGEFNQESIRQADAIGQTVVMWSVVSGDPDPKLPASRIVDDVVSRMKNGSVVVFHANGRGWHTAEVFPKVYEQVVAKHGEAARTISQLRSGCSAR